MVRSFPAEGRHVARKASIAKGDMGIHYPSAQFEVYPHDHQALLGVGVS